jgi:hypothetical protein
MTTTANAAVGLLFAMSLAMLQGPARGEVLKPTLDVSDMRIVLFYISMGERASSPSNCRSVCETTQTVPIGLSSLQKGINSASQTGAGSFSMYLK